jgi:beta-lactam-binding protein with PASTA domain
VKIAKHPPGPAMTTVPNLIGKTAAQANAALAGHSLAGDKHEVSTNTKPAFKVYVQNPPAGASVPVGSTVHFTIAKPVLVQNVAVPNLIGKTQMQAGAALAAADLGSDFDHHNAPGKPAGKVYQQNPAAGTLVPKNTVVHARVATLSMVTVPNLIGLTPAQANAALAIKGLGSNGKIEFSLFKPPGKVYSQSKNPGTSVLMGATIHWKANP